MESMLTWLGELVTSFSATAAPPVLPAEEPVLPAEEPPRLMRLEGDGSNPNAWVCVLPRRPLPRLSPEDWAKLREERAVYHKDSDIKRHRGWLDKELAFLLPRLAAHHEAAAAAAAH
jgi:hypothetical protein